MQKMPGQRSFRSHFEMVKRLIMDPNVPTPAMAALFIAEILVNITVIWKIKCKQGLIPELDLDV